MLRKIILAGSLLLGLLPAGAAFAAPQITFALNGSAENYAPGSMLIVYGKIADGQAPLSGTDAFIEITNLSEGGKPIYYSQVKTNGSGYFRTAFNLPDNAELVHDQLQVSVRALQQVKSETVTVQEKSKGVDLDGFTPKGYASGQAVQEIPSDTSKLVFAFTKNVNYFYNKNAGELAYLGKNEKNEDCIELFLDGKKIPASVRLLDTGGESTVSYNKLNDGTEGRAQERQMIAVSPIEALIPGKTYRVVVSGELSANNSSTLGVDKEVLFTVTAAPTVIKQPGRSGGSGGVPAAINGVLAQYQQEGIPVSSLGEWKEEGARRLLTVDYDKAAKLLNNESLPALLIDIRNNADSGNTAVAAKLPLEVVELAVSRQKAVMLQKGDMVMYIPHDALVKGREMTFGVSSETVSSHDGPEDTSGLALYRLEAASEDNALHRFSKEIILSLPIPSSVSDAEKLGVYYRDPTGSSWEYMGGRVRDGKLVFKTDHFSEFVVAESTKKFQDMESHWARRDVEILSSWRIIDGAGPDVFMPDRRISRAEFATILARALKLEGEAVQNFTDVSSDAWYASYVGLAAQAGLIEGADGLFRPNDQVTREEIAVMLDRAFAYAGGKLMTADDPAFTDFDQVSGWAKNAVRSVYSAGIVNGRPDGSFGASDSAVRAECAAMLKRLMEKLGLYNRNHTQREGEVDKWER